MIDDRRNIIVYYEKTEQIEVIANKLGSFQKQLEGSGSGANHGKPCNFYLRLSWETVFSTLKLLQNFCTNSYIYSLSLSHIPCLKHYPHNQRKYESKERKEVYWKYIGGKTSRFQLFLDVGKLEKSSQSYFNFQSLCEFENTWK